MSRVFSRGLENRRGHQGEGAKIPGTDGTSRQWRDDLLRDRQRTLLYHFLLDPISTQVRLPGFGTLNKSLKLWIIFSPDRSLEYLINLLVFLPQLLVESNIELIPYLNLGVSRWSRSSLINRFDGSLKLLHYASGFPPASIVLPLVAVMHM
jgi:hypothetical protein